jgi:hypothetical protein
MLSPRHADKFRGIPNLAKKNRPEPGGATRMQTDNANYGVLWLWLNETLTFSIGKAAPYLKFSAIDSD